MFLVHEKFMDVFVEVLRTIKSDSQSCTYKVRYWNWGFDGSSPWVVPNGKKEIKILNKDAKHWSWFNPNIDIHPGRKNEKP